MINTSGMSFSCINHYCSYMILFEDLITPIKNKSLPPQAEKGELANFGTVKSIISDCICLVTTYFGQKLSSDILNNWANSYTDKLLEKVNSKD